MKNKLALLLASIVFASIANVSAMQPKKPAQEPLNWDGSLNFGTPASDFKAASKEKEKSSANDELESFRGLVSKVSAVMQTGVGRYLHCLNCVDLENTDFNFVKDCHKKLIEQWDELYENYLIPQETLKIKYAYHMCLFQLKNVAEEQAQDIIVGGNNHRKNNNLAELFIQKLSRESCVNNVTFFSSIVSLKECIERLQK